MHGCHSSHTQYTPDKHFLKTDI